MEANDHNSRTSKIRFSIQIPVDISRQTGLEELKGEMETFLTQQEFPPIDYNEILNMETFLVDYFSTFKILSPERITKMCYPLLVHLTLPHLSKSKESHELFRLCVSQIGFIFAFDDLVDSQEIVSLAGESSESTNSFKIIMQKFAKIFEGKSTDALKKSVTLHEQKCDKLESHFAPFYALAFDINEKLHKTIPHFSESKKHFVDGMSKLFSAHVMLVDKDYHTKLSEESWKFCMRLATGFEPAIEMVTLLMGIQLPESIRSDPYFLRVLNGGSLVFCCVNDIFGVAKDLKNGEMDSLLMMRFVNSKLSLQESFDSTLALLNGEIRDMKILFEKMRSSYDKDNQVLLWICGVEQFLEGYIRFCASARKYNGTNFHYVGE